MTHLLDAAPRRAARTAGLGAALATTLVLGGCAGLNTLRSDVNSFGDWPAGRAPGRYVIERLPSQQTAPETPLVEGAARAALERTGFRAVADPAQAEVTVQVTGKATQVLRPYHADPFWSGRFGFGGFYGGRGGVGLGLGFGGPFYNSPMYDREVSLVLRERPSGRVLYETKALSYGSTPGDETVFTAMFDAALNGFPQTGGGPRKVAIPLDGVSASNSTVVQPAPASAPR